MLESARFWLRIYRGVNLSALLKWGVCGAVGLGGVSVAQASAYPQVLSLRPGGGLLKAFGDNFSSALLSEPAFFGEYSIGLTSKWRISAAVASTFDAALTWGGLGLTYYFHGVAAKSEMASENVQIITTPLWDFYAGGHMCYSRLTLPLNNGVQIMTVGGSMLGPEVHAGLMYNFSSQWALVADVFGLWAFSTIVATSYSGVSVGAQFQFLAP